MDKVASARVKDKIPVERETEKAPEPELAYKDVLERIDPLLSRVRCHTHQTKMTTSLPTNHPHVHAAVASLSGSVALCIQFLAGDCPAAKNVPQTILQAQRAF